MQCNAVNNDGETALHLCSLSGNEVIAKNLLQAPDIDASKLNGASTSALEYAQRSGHKGLVKLLSAATSRSMASATATPVGSRHSSPRDNASGANAGTPSSLRSGTPNVDKDNTDASGESDGVD